jgi:quercetin dioxygenase-like cupin family protein
MYRILICAAAGAFFISTQTVAQQAPGPNPDKPYYITPLENDFSRIVRLRAVIFPANGDSGFHRHPGDQWNTVQDGEVTLTVKGEAPRTLKIGDSAYIPRGTVHRNQNLTDRPARVIELNIMDKDKPDLESVTE